jgi:hypothetical protein
MKSIHSILAGLLVFLSGCSNAKIEDYADKKPAIDIRNYFNGEVEAMGVYIDRAGMADPQFHVKMKGTWKGNSGTLEEHFTYSDGRKDEHRTWNVQFTDEHHFTATAHDVVGAAKGAQFGNAVNMRYVLRVPVKGSTYDISMDDWMYMMDEKTVINRVTMRKFGIKVGELFITFRKK